jgi:hypothetical protein
MARNLRKARSPNAVGSSVLEKKHPLCSTTPSTPPTKKQKQSNPRVKPEVRKKQSSSAKDELHPEVQYMSPPRDRSKEKQQKGFSRVSKKNVDWEVPGPDKTDEDCGRMRLDDSDIYGLRHQGMMITGFTTTAYLSLLANCYFDAGVRRSEDSFLSSLTGYLSNAGNTHG